MPSPGIYVFAVNDASERNYGRSNPDSIEWLRREDQSMNSMVVATGVTSQPASITVAWSDGTAGEFASIWLRDNLPEDRDRHSGQRLVDVMDIPVDAAHSVGLLD